MSRHFREKNPTILTNAIDPAKPGIGITGKGEIVGNYIIPEEIYKRELAEYEHRKIEGEN